MALQKLPSATIKLIGSSQVITSVSSAVKELVENSIDAGATTIDVRLDNYGLDKIEVKDDGCGILRQDVKFACLKSYTSKISSFEDLENLSCYGFRGEALNALCTLSQVSVTTISGDEDIAYCHIMDCNGSIKQSKPSHIMRGTVICVEGLLRRIPVRRQRAIANGKKSEELRKCEMVVKRLAAVHPNLRMTIAHDKCTLWVKSRCRSILDSVCQVVPPTVARQLHYLPFCDDKDKFDIILPKKDCNVPTICYNSLNEATQLYINLRPISDRTLEKEVQSELFQYFGHYIPSGKFPYIFISIHLSPKAVDVNLEPNKTKAIVTDSDQLVIKLKKVICDYYCSGKLVEEDNLEDSSVSTASKRKCDTALTDLEPREKVIKIGNNKLVTLDNSKNVSDNDVDFSQLLDVKGEDVSELVKDLISDVTIPFDANPCATSTQLDDCKKEGFDPHTEKSSNESQTLSSREQNITNFVKDLFYSSSAVNQESSKECPHEYSSANCYQPSNSDNSSKMETYIGARIENEPIKIVLDDPLISSHQNISKKKDTKNGLIVSKSAELFLDTNIDAAHVNNIVPDDYLETAIEEIKEMSSEMNSIVDKNSHLVQNKPFNSEFDDVTLSQWSRGHVPVGNKGLVESSVAVASGAALGAMTACNSEASSVHDSSLENFENSNEQNESEVASDQGNNIEHEKENKPKVSIESQMGMKHMAGFSKFAKETKSKLLEKCPGMSFVGVASKLASEWKSLDPKEKKVYEQQAKDEKVKISKGESSSKSDPGRPIVIRKNSYEKTCYMEVSLTSIKKDYNQWKSSEFNNEVVFGHLEEDVHIFFEARSSDRNQAEISAFSGRRLKEALLFYKNLSTMEIPSKALEEPWVLRQDQMDRHLWEYLDSFKRDIDPRDGSTVILDDSLVKNGFRIEFSLEEDGQPVYRVTNVAAQIGHIAVEDLKELLRGYKLSRDIARARPLKIVSYIRSETVRSLDCSSEESVDSDRMGSSLNFFLKSVSGVLPKCPHHRLVVKSLHTFNVK